MGTSGSALRQEGSTQSLQSVVDNYDVFINFRGTDTRKGFVKILYDDLVAEGMRVFLDDEELNYGKRLDEELPQAINNSKIYITVISETYASSKWCLRELTEIVKNKQQFKEKKEILPVFYKIKTDDVKLKTDLFKNQLNGLLKEKKVGAETVQEWGETLKGITDLKAWKVPIHGSLKEDGEFCREIVKRASIILRVKHKSLPKDLIGMNDPIKEMMQLLDIGNPDMQIIGIHGMGGSGKTTLAKAVYNKLCDDQFDCCCFMPNVRESLDKDEGSKGCLELQKRLLKEISYRGGIDEIRDADEGLRRIQLTLEGKKVLMVIDDVSKLNHIASLIGDNYSIFGRESRIIITTRDHRVMQKREFAKITKIHEMKAMDNKHALELFSWHAFGEPTPPKGYSSLSNDAVKMTGRLPLSLEITGSLFSVGGRKNWKQTVEKLKKMPNEDVQERLKISYEDLNEQTREIFLDIACFFVDKPRTHEVNMWDACGFFPELAIEELISMCLIKIERYGIYGSIYRMHDHIKDLGREIVRQEGPKDKEQRSRIWNKHDAIDILTAGTKKENNKIEGIFLDCLNSDDGILILRGENCVNLDRLRFLHFEGSDSTFAKSIEVLVEGSFEHVLPNLRWLTFQRMKMMRFNETNFFSFFWTSNATNFMLKKLVVLNFSHSDVAETWVGWKQFKDLPSLEVLNLKSCLGLKRTPDLSHCKSLKTLVLFCCENLEEIDGSVTSLPKLQHLDLSYCKKLKNLPDSVGNLVELEELLLMSCKGLVCLPNSLTSLPKLLILKLSYCSNLESLPESVGEMVQLTELDISNSALKKLPGFIISKQKRLQVLLADWIQIQGVPKEIEELTCLREISLNGSSITELPSLVKLTSLEKLSLMSCNQLQLLPAELPASLVQLHVSSSSLSLQSVPDYSYLIHLTDLQFHLLNKFGEYVTSFDWMWRLSKLKKLQLSMSKTSTTTILSEESHTSVRSQLEELTFHCSVLGTCVIPSFLSILRTLDISLYRETTSLSLPRLNRLTHFILLDCSDLAQILGLGELECLRSLQITRCISLEILDDISKLSQLRALKITECTKLRVISVVPCVRSLKEIVIIECESLNILVGSSGSESCLSDLHRVEHLKIVDCRLLENKLPKELEKIKGRFLE